MGRGLYKRFTGVYRTSNGKYQAKIGEGGKMKHLGVFESEEDAARAYDERARVVHGDRAKLNFPRPGELHWLGLGDTGESIENRIPGYSRFTGVQRTSNGKYRAKIMEGGKYKCLGTFESEEDAARAYDESARLAYGDRAKLNFPDGYQCKTIMAYIYIF